MSFQFQLQNPPQDIVSAVRFNKCDTKSSLLLASSWDATVSLYDTLADNGRLLARVDGVAPLLDCCWSADGDHAFIGGLENRVRKVDAITGNSTLIGDHDDAVSSLVYHEHSGQVVSGSWDRTVQLNDERSSRKAIVCQQPHKVFTMDMTANLLVVGMASRAIHVYDIRNMGEPFQRRESSLKRMTRAIKCIPTGEGLYFISGVRKLTNLGYASSSIEGRIAVDFVDPSPAVQAKKYAFKCHREVKDNVDIVYPVNALAFHPIHGTFVSGGSDALVCFWDYKARKRLRQYPRYPGPIQSLDIDSQGTMLAVAYGSESELGYDGSSPAVNGVAIRSLTPSEGKSKS